MTERRAWLRVINPHPVETLVGLTSRPCTQQVITQLGTFINPDFGTTLEFTMDIEFVKYRASTRRPHALLQLTAQILLQLSKALDPAELELAVLKDQLLENKGYGPRTIADYVDTEDLTQDALDQAFPPDGPDSVDMEDVFVKALATRAWELVYEALPRNYEISP